MQKFLFRLLAISLVVGISAAHGQTCVADIPFPTVGVTVVPPGTCIASSGQTGRLRWDNNGSGELQLFDTDDGKTLLWCAHLNDGNSTCAKGSSFCLVSTGNMAITSGANCTGTLLWESSSISSNLNGAVLTVGDNFLGCGGSFVGEKAMILDHLNSGVPCLIWTDPSPDPS